LRIPQPQILRFTKNARRVKATPNYAMITADSDIARQYRTPPIATGTLTSSTPSSSTPFGTRNGLAKTGQPTSQILISRREVRANEMACGVLGDIARGAEILRGRGRAAMSFVNCRGDIGTSELNQRRRPIFKWINQHLRIKAFFGISANAVKTQIWIAISIYVRFLSPELEPFRPTQAYRNLTKQNDLLMNCLRYLCVSGRERMRNEPKPAQVEYHSIILPGTPQGWMAN
jgi:hypothetical protein